MTSYLENQYDDDNFIAKNEETYDKYEDNILKLTKQRILVFSTIEQHNRY